MGSDNTDFEFGPETMLKAIPLFSKKIEHLCELVGLNAASLELDHIAMRVNQSSDAERSEFVWGELGKIISKSEINGRPIVVLELDQPITVGQWKTGCIELPYPAIGKYYEIQGWEHVEYVVPCNANTIEEFVVVVRNTFPDLDRCWGQLSELGVKIKMSQPKGDKERLANPTIAFKWKNVTIKLHPHSLKAVIQSEQSPL